MWAFVIDYAKLYRIGRMDAIEMCDQNFSSNLVPLWRELNWSTRLNRSCLILYSGCVSFRVRERVIVVFPDYFYAVF